MKATVLTLAMILTLASCASSHHAAHNEGDFHRYPACLEKHVGGRLLHDPGWVVGESDATSGDHIFAFLSTYWGRIIEVTRVNRFCSILRSRLDASADRPYPDRNAPPSTFP